MVVVLRIPYYTQINLILMRASIVIENAEVIAEKVRELASMGAMEIKVNGWSGYIQGKFSIGE